MKVYELMHLLATCPASADVRVSKVLGLDELADLVKETHDEGVAEISSTVTDFHKRTAVTENDTVELYLD